MITLKDFMELIDYRITEGSDYGWQCFGPDAYSLSYWNGDYKGHSFNIVFDTKTQRVYTVEVVDYQNTRAYRIIDPEYKAAHDSEAEDRDVDPKEAWDECQFVDLDVDDDFIEKARAIRAGEDYDTRVLMPINLPEDVLLTLMKQAHEQDITFNQHMENILKNAVDHAFAELKDEYDFTKAVTGAPAKMKAGKRK